MDSQYLPFPVTHNPLSDTRTGTSEFRPVHLPLTTLHWSSGDFITGVRRGGSVVSRQDRTA